MQSCNIPEAHERQKVTKTRAYRILWRRGILLHSSLLPSPPPRHSLYQKELRQHQAKSKREGSKKYLVIVIYRCCPGVWNFSMCPSQEKKNGINVLRRDTITGSTNMALWPSKSLLYPFINSLEEKKHKQHKLRALTKMLPLKVCAQGSALAHLPVCSQDRDCHVLKAHDQHHSDPLPFP